MNIIGLATKVFGAIGQFLLRKWLFKAEFVGGACVVYVSERGDSPFVSIQARVRVHNRNSSPTAVFCERTAVQLPDGTEDSFPLATGSESVVRAMTQDRMIQIGGASTTEITFYSCRHNPPQLDAYLSGHPVEIRLSLGETFGCRLEITRSLGAPQVVRQ